jgi:hypothetical protein
MDYRNLGASKAWDLTLLSHEQYVALDASSLSPWMSMPGFTFETVSFDWMHNIYLGTGRDLFASGLKTLVERGVYDYTGLTDTDDLLFHAEGRMRAACSEHKLLIYKWGFVQMMAFFTCFFSHGVSKWWCIKPVVSPHGHSYIMVSSNGS